MKSSLCNELLGALQVEEKVPVRIWDGFTFYVLSVLPCNTLVTGKFVPCAKNAQVYTVPLDDIQCLAHFSGD